MAKDIWAVKYRPATLDDYIFQNPKQKSYIAGLIEDKSIPHLLLVGTPGTGKTSLAYLLKKLIGIEDIDFLYNDASKDNSIDVIRNKVNDFVSTFATSPFKIVLMDEADQLTINAQNALRAIVENNADNARFIFTCNNPNKIHPAIVSRCHEIKFKSLDRDDVMDMAARVLQAEKVKVPSIEVLDEYINVAYPDCRKLLNLLQNNVKDGVLQPAEELDSTLELNLRLVALMESDDYAGLRDALAGKLDDNDWDGVYRFFYEYLHEIGKFKDTTKWKKGIIIIAHHLHCHAIVADPEINAMAMFIKLGEV